jgi:hypothetical protein
MWFLKLKKKGSKFFSGKKKSIELTFLVSKKGIIKLGFLAFKNTSNFLFFYFLAKSSKLAFLVNRIKLAFLV